MAFDKIIQWSPEQWAEGSARLIQAKVEELSTGNNGCNVMLTGGRSAEDLYAVWGGLSNFKSINGVDFYFGDERCVSPDADTSNYGLAKRTLFRHGVPSGCRIHRMRGEEPDGDVAAEMYEDRLPDRIDVMLFGVGEDGHIASLFPEHKALWEVDRKVVSVMTPKAPYQRLTITPPVIDMARNVFVLARGSRKVEVLRKIIKQRGDFHRLPARLLAEASWLIDTPLCGETS